MTAFLLALTVLSALGFAFANGMTDSPHSFAPSVRTGALRPRIALAFSAFFTFLGAVSGSVILSRALTGLTLPDGPAGLVLLLASAISALGMGLAAHALSRPTSSTNALVFSLVGAALAAQLLSNPGPRVEHPEYVLFVLGGLLLSPPLMFGLTRLIMRLVLRMTRAVPAPVVGRRARVSQVTLSGFFSFSHGLQDAQRASYLIIAAVIAAGGAGVKLPSALETGWTAALLSAAVIALGACFGSWRIGHTITYRLTRISPLSGSVGAASAAGVLLISSVGLGLPLSSTHLFTASTLSAGSVENPRSVSWNWAVDVLLFWLAVPVVSTLLGGALYLSLSPLVG